MHGRQGWCCCVVTAAVETRDSGHAAETRHNTRAPRQPCPPNQTAMILSFNSSQPPWVELGTNLCSEKVPIRTFSLLKLPTSALTLTPSFRQLIFPILGVTIHIFWLVGDKLRHFWKFWGKKFTRGALGGCRHFQGNLFLRNFYCEYSLK